MQRVQTKFQRVLITGCGGMLGNAIYPYFLARFSQVLATDKVTTWDWLEPLDVRDKVRLASTFSSFRPDLVLHLAAETDLEYCETHPDAADETNRHATATVARLAEDYGATLVYISTAGVFDGKKADAYTEEDLPRPIMVYGQTKYDGEIAARQNCHKTFVVRAGWMMGGGRSNEKKFIYEILKQLREGRQVIHAVTDRWGTPTYTYDFTHNLFRLLETDSYGIYHMVCEGCGTRYDVAREILDVCNRPDVKLEAVDSDFFKERYFAPRPVSEIMCNAALTSLGCNHMRNWKVSLSDYLNTFFTDFIAGRYAHMEYRREERASVHQPLLFLRESSNAPVAELCEAIVTDRSSSSLGIVTGHELQVGQTIFISLTHNPNHLLPADVLWTESIGRRTRAGLMLVHTSTELVA